MKNISDKDLKSLYELVLKIVKIGEKYGLSTFSSVFVKAYEELKKK